MPAQASPMDMPPSCNGETRTPAAEDRTRRRPSSVGGVGSAMIESCCDGGGDDAGEE